jgi:hypothetical protein
MINSIFLAFYLHFQDLALGIQSSMLIPFLLSWLTTFDSRKTYAFGEISDILGR